EGGRRGVGAAVAEVGADGGGGTGGEGAVPGGVGDGDVLAGLAPVAAPAFGEGLVAGVGVGQRPAGDRGGVVGDGDRRAEPAPDVAATAVPAASPIAATRQATYLTLLVAPGWRSLMTYTSVRDGAAIVGRAGKPWTALTGCLGKCLPPGSQRI